METSILTSTKKILGVAEDYTAFDQDILTHINSAFNTLNDIGVGPKPGFAIEDKSSVWSDFIGDDPQLNQVKSYVYLKTRMLFDPPTTSFLIDAMNKQIEQFEWRLSVYRESNVVTQPSKRRYEGVFNGD